MPAPPVKSKAGSESGGPTTSRAPSGAASQSSVTTGSGFPTIAGPVGTEKEPTIEGGTILEDSDDAFDQVR